MVVDMPQTDRRHGTGPRTRESRDGDSWSGNVREGDVRPRERGAGEPRKARPAADPTLNSTAYLIDRFRSGDRSARDLLIERYLPILRRWAHGRLPGYARGTAETDDLVQLTLIRALDRLGTFEVRREGAFLAYLRSIFLNAVRDEIRRWGRSPGSDEVKADLKDGAPSAVEGILGKEKLERYERALARLPEDHRQAVLMRVEFGLSYQRIAEALERPSANAARMTVSRALARLAEAIDDGT